MPQDENTLPRYDEMFDSPTEASIQNLTPEELEGFVAYLFNREGTVYARVVDGPQDGGVDIELWSSALPTASLVGVAQVKHNMAQDIEARKVRAFVEAMTKAHTKTGYFISVRHFRPGAYDYARRSSINGQLVRLLDVDDLLRWAGQIKAREQRGPADQSARNTSVVPVLCVANNKGGVGKTTIVGSVAAELAARGNRVVLIDADPQANLTSWLAASPDVAPAASLYAVLVGDEPIEPRVRDTTIDGVRLLPSSRALYHPPAGLSPFVMERRLRAALAQYLAADPLVSFVLIDTPPALDWLTRAALVAAGHVLLPLELDYFSWDGVKHLLSFIQEVESAHALAPLQIVGGVASLVNPNMTNLGSEYNRSIPVAAAEHPRLRGGTLTANNFWCGQITDLEAFLRAQANRKTVVQPGSESRATNDVRHLTDEILRRVRPAVASIARQQAAE
jgi:chromosome partitioning protein